MNNVIFNRNGIVRKYTTLTELSDAEPVGLVQSNSVIMSSDLDERFFICLVNDSLYISDSLKFIKSETDVDFDSESISFHENFGFIYPPRTQYTDVFITAPYVSFFIDKKIEFQTVMIDEKLNDNPGEVVELLDSYFSLDKSHHYSILVSGGIDSSVLLGYSSEKTNLVNAYMCKMSSIPKEEKVAEKQCASINTPFNLFNLNKDLTDRAIEFLSETGEIISDPIAPVFPEMLARIAENEESAILLDGQGADSLFNGLPHNKLYDYWAKTKLIRPLFYLFKIMPTYERKKTSLSRKLYRASKVLKCLSYSNFRDCLLYSLSAQFSLSNAVVRDICDDMDLIYSKKKDWHYVIRYIFMFRILPAREMQKYLLAKRYNIEFKLPFISKTFLDEYMSSDSAFSIIGKTYKYPMQALAQKYWPGVFSSSATSPFQVEYKLGSSNLLEISYKQLSK